MLTVDELAIQLKISRGTVIKLIKNGDITAIKVGDQYRVPEANYQRFISTATLSIMKPDSHLEDFKAK
jgi:excisionase family DNA binding protein